MSRPQKHIAQSNSGKYNYLLFDSVFAFNAFVDHEIQQLSSSNASRWNNVVQSTSQNLNSGTDWYGTPTPKDVKELEEHRTFLGMKLAQKIQPQVKDKLATYLDYLQDSVLPKPKMAYNDRGLGVFSFERAAMAMYKDFPVNTQTPVSTAVSQMNIELRNHQISTSVKSVYAYFQDKQMSYPSMQLYIMAGANANVKGDQLLYVGLACAELVDFLELRGISVEVNVMLGTSFRNQVAMACVRVKRFQDKLDKNQLLLTSSDPRYFRYRGFKGLVALSNYFGLTIPSGLGSITAQMGTAFAKAINPAGFVFEQSYAMETAVKEVTQIIENYKNQLAA
ncbi:hypothetical protein LX97_00492 [Nonlabens dokdonensis]|uniref:DUF7192 domain-containing protein n=1 Tax=Nonlabens dokdonensis TaxID=328515 RepID=A0ABX5Q0G8_9FLAO|nr:hypothetical protein [Nonlabens dokdonensis]PZX43491.1 hypothetical protein LX97_00492 [Nonlabens dokdonensis]